MNETTDIERELLESEGDAAKDKLWMAARIRQQWAEIERLSNVLRRIRDCTTLNSKAGQWARHGLANRSYERDSA